LEDAPVLNKDALERLGKQLQQRFVRYESERRVQELKWLRNLRQWLGQYDPDVEAQLGPHRSRAYPKLTRIEVISMVSRLTNMLFPASEKNWSIDPSPTPNLPPEVLGQIADEVMKTLSNAQGIDSVLSGDDVVNEALERAIRAVAEERARVLEKEVEDYLAELGGSSSLP